MRRLLPVLLAITLHFLRLGAVEMATDIAVTSAIHAEASLDSISYIDENGEEQSLEWACDTITENTTTLTPGWWIASRDVIAYHRIEIVGTMNLILADGCTLNAMAGIHADKTTRFNIYGQRKGTGTLLATGTAYGAGIGGKIHEESGIFTINGGIIYAVGDQDGAGIGGGANSNWSGEFGNNQQVIINGGTVYAHSPGNGAGIGGGGTSSAIYVIYPGAGGEITINGGQVIATSGGGYGMGPGISPCGFAGQDGIISLSWRNCGDYAYASSYRGQVNFNKAFAIEGGTTLATPETADGKMLKAAHKITFTDNDSQSIIAIKATTAGNSFPTNDIPVKMEGYKAEWLLDGKFYDFRQIPSGDLNLVATEWILRGDIDNDENIDVSDINILINIILSNCESGVYERRAYITDDYEIDVTDVNTLINIILNR